MGVKRGILKVLLQEIAELTLDVCKECKIREPLSCCDRLYCEIAENFARRIYQIKLEHTGHKSLLFMGDNGCIVEPHLRPLCTLHVCSIQKEEYQKNTVEFNERYFKLKYRVDDLLLEIENHKS